MSACSGLIGLRTFLLRNQPTFLMMAESPPDVKLSWSNADMLELNKDLERMTDSVENLTVQVTWMAHDMVALRTSPEVVDSMRELEEAYLRCRSAVFGDPQPEPESS